MFHPYSDKNKFGYYTVGDYKTYSKLEAYEESKKTNNAVKRYFNDEVFSAIDCTIEPPLTIWEYYTQRAQQIRDKYDYVVVMYSGGADSKTVVDSFIKNNIHVDEIAQFTHAEGSGKEAFMDREVWKVAVPTTAGIVEETPTTKHRLIDLSKYYYTEFNDAEFKFDFIYQVNNFLHPLSSIRTRIRDYVDDWKHIIDSGKKLCLVWGGDKPLVYYDWRYKKHLFSFNDVVDQMVTPMTQQVDNPGWFDELFYWTPDLPALPIKQAHLIKNFLQNPDHSLNWMYRVPGNNHPHPTEYENTDVDKRSGSTVINGDKWYLKREAMHRLIYPTWDVTTFTDGKPPSIITHPRDAWFWGDTSSLNTARKNFYQGVTKFQQSIPKHALLKEDNFLRGLKPIFTRYYALD